MMPGDGRRSGKPLLTRPGHVGDCHLRQLYDFTDALGRSKEIDTALGRVRPLRSPATVRRSTGDRKGRTLDIYISETALVRRADINYSAGSPTTVNSRSGDGMPGVKSPKRALTA